MKPLINCLFLAFILCSSLGAHEEEAVSGKGNTQYANSSVYAPFEDSYLHIACYDEFRIFTNVDMENFGDQQILSYDGSVLYDNEGRNQYVLYPYFFVLVNYYHAFEVWTVSQWPYDGVNALPSPMRQYIEFYE